MTPELKSLCDRLQVLSGYLAAADEEEAFPIVDEAAAKLREMAGALEAVQAAMLQGGDGAVGDYGWSVTKLNKARPLIRAVLGGSHG